jgi:hypothetical protein
MLVVHAEDGPVSRTAHISPLGKVRILSFASWGMTEGSILHLLEDVKIFISVSFGGRSLGCLAVVVDALVAEGLVRSSKELRCWVVLVRLAIEADHDSILIGKEFG